MKVIYHLGVHCTDEHRLIGCLRQNVAVLAEQGVVVPDPELYRPILRNVVNAMKGARASAETEETVLDAVMTQDEAARVVFSNEAFLCVRHRALQQGMLYQTAADKTLALANLLPSCEAELALAIRNPATFLPALYQSTKINSFDEFLGGTDPLALSWADMIERIRQVLPEVPITVWCDEDTPLIWPEVLRAVAGCAPQTPLQGEGELLAAIMSPEGLARMGEFLAARPGLSEAQRRRAVAAFLDKYALEDKIEMELDLPGWTEAYVEELTGRYDEDVEDIAAIPGVRLLSPWPQDIPSADL